VCSWASAQLGQNRMSLCSVCISAEAEIAPAARAAAVKRRSLQIVAQQSQNRILPPVSTNDEKLPLLNAGVKQTRCSDLCRKSALGH
jgi:hypothetical protein